MNITSVDYERHSRCSRVGFLSAVPSDCRFLIGILMTAAFAGSRLRFVGERDNARLARKGFAAPQLHPVPSDGGLRLCARPWHAGLDA